MMQRDVIELLGARLLVDALLARVWWTDQSMEMMDCGNGDEQHETLWWDEHIGPAMTGQLGLCGEIFFMEFVQRNCIFSGMDYMG